MNAGDLFSTLHCIPPQLRGSDSLDDARLLYRLSCKGEPCGERPSLGSSLACRLSALLFLMRVASAWLCSDATAP